MGQGLREARRGDPHPLNPVADIPKVGPFKGLAFNNPTAKTEDLYIKSINTTADQYRVFLHQARTETLVLPNVDLDSGQATKATEYSLTDEAYAKLLAQVAGRKFDLTTPELRDNILDFYSDLVDRDLPTAQKTEERTVESKEWTVKDLMEALKRFPLEAKVYYEMGPNRPGTIGKAQYVKVWGDDELGVLLDR